MPVLWSAAAIVLVVNLPFGFWRAGVRRFSVPWVVAVHAPVPLVVAIRYLSGLGWHLITFPVLVGAFFTGQFVGGRLRRLTRGAAALEALEKVPGDVAAGEPDDR